MKKRICVTLLGMALMMSSLAGCGETKTDVSDVTSEVVKAGNQWQYGIGRRNRSIDDDATS